MKLKREDEKAREYESLTRKTIELNVSVAQLPSVSRALSKWWQHTDGMWGKVQSSFTKGESDQYSDADEKAALGHCWFSMMVWLNLALSKEGRNSFDSSQNKKAQGISLNTRDYLVQSIESICSVFLRESKECSN